MHKALFKSFKYTFLGFLGIAIVYLVWGTVIEPHLLFREAETGEIPNLPSAWEGKKVAVISDWQIGIWLDNTSTIRQAVEQIIEERPVLVLIVGDFIYHPGKNPEQELNQVVQLARPLTKAGLPTYAVLGNHDYAVGSLKEPANEHLGAKVEAALEAIDIIVLHNEAVELTLREYTQSSQSDRRLYLVGIGSYLAQKDQPQAVSDVPDDSARLIMMHNPNSFEALPPNAAPLAIAGHTHGGQINLLPFGKPLWFFLTYDEEELVHKAGWIEDFGQPGNRLYVNRGIGFSNVPIRINAPPELTIFTLESANRESVNK